MPEPQCSELPRELELIVVDDGSTDDSAAIASEHADLIRLPVARVARVTRDRGVERARGDAVLLGDADVVVRPDTLSRVVAMMSSRPEIDAVFGAYCDEPAAAGVVSQYRNLLHHFTHEQEPGDAQTFWAGCGCVRRSVFLAVGMYDEWRFSRAQIEDVELGYRMSARGYHILLRPEIQVASQAMDASVMLKADLWIAACLGTIAR